MNKTLGKDKINFEQSYRLVIIFALISAIICLSIGYASFNTIIQINTQTSLPIYNWNIAFSNLSNPAIEGHASEIKTPLTSSSSILLNLEFIEPNDSISYNFDVINLGNLDAKLNNTPVITINPSNLQNDFIITITHLDGSPLETNEKLLAGNKQKMLLKIVYNPQTEHPINLKTSFDIILYYIQT